MNVDITDLKTVRLSQDGSAVIILDQTCLPGSEVYVSLSSAEEIWEAIYRLKVRGAPAIGIAAAYGIYVCSRQIAANTYGGFCSEFLRIKDYLASSRPTAVNLVAALDRMEKVVVAHSVNPVPEIVELLRVEAEAIRAEDAAACRKIGENCLSLLRPGMGILTHCNAGHLAVSEYGTEGFRHRQRHIGFGFDHLRFHLLGQCFHFLFSGHSHRPPLFRFRLSDFQISFGLVDL